MKLYESDIERPTVRYARDLGLIAIKLYPWHQQGIPDRLFIGPGPRFEFVEFKRDGEKPKKGQLKWIARLKQFNIYVNVIDNLAEAKALIQSMTIQISTTIN